MKCYNKYISFIYLFLLLFCLRWLRNYWSFTLFIIHTEYIAGEQLLNATWSLLHVIYWNTAALNNYITYFLLIYFIPLMFPWCIWRQNLNVNVSAININQFQSLCFTRKQSLAIHRRQQWTYKYICLTDVILYNSCITLHN